MLHCGATIPEPDTRGCDVLYTCEPRIFYKDFRDAVENYLTDTETRTLRAELYRLEWDSGVEQRAVITWTGERWTEPVWADVE